MARLVPYQEVIGERGTGGGLAALRLRDGRRPEAVPASELLHRIAVRVAASGTGLWG